MKRSLRETRATFPLRSLWIGACLLYALAAVVRAHERLSGLGFERSGAFEALTDLLQAGMCILLIAILSRSHPTEWGPLVRWRPRTRSLAAQVKLAPGLAPRAAEEVQQDPGE
jgi:hypothetical protein